MPEARDQRWGRPVWVGWAWAVAVTMALILVPFALWGAPIEAFVRSRLAASEASGAVMALVVTVLALDVILPVPSSIVAVAAGYELGGIVGTLANFLGLQIGCGLGWLVGQRAGGRPLEATVGSTSRATASQALNSLKGQLLFAIGRAVPVVAEGSVLLAGAAEVPPQRLLYVATVANVGVAGVYAVAGAWSAETGSAVPATLGAIGVPAVAILLAHRISARSSRAARQSS